MIKEAKTTIFSSHRFIVPYDWFNKALNNSEPDQALYNSIFLNQRKNAFKKKIDLNEIVIVIYEIMDYIISSYDVDYIIIVKFNNKDNKIDLEEVEIFTPNEFSTKLINSKYEKINVEKGYLTSQDFSVVDPNNLGDSTNELLNEPKQTEKEDNSQFIRKVNSSGKSSSSKNQKELDKKKLNDDKNDDIKLSVNIKNGNNNTNNSNDNNSNDKNNGEWNTEELNPNEKFHNITQKYYRHLYSPLRSLKDLTQTKDELKKK